MKNVYKPNIDEVRGDQEWSLLEQDLLDECVLGRVAYLPDKQDVPTDTSDPDRRVRASLIRYLMLGGCDGEGGARPHPKGIVVQGGWIDGVIDLAACSSELDLSLFHCLFPSDITLRDAKLGAVHLTGSDTNAQVDLHRLRTRSEVLLRDGFKAVNAVDLAGATIGGQLDCSDGQFHSPDGVAINAATAKIAADVFLRGKEFSADGEVRLLGAEIGGQLSCYDGRFRNPDGVAIDVSAAQIGADLFLRDAQVKGKLSFIRSKTIGNVDATGLAQDGIADFEAAEIGQGLLWQKVSGNVSGVDLTEAKVGVLRDDEASWENVPWVFLGGFRYERLLDPLSIRVRKSWLQKSINGDVPIKERGFGLIKSKNVGQLPDAPQKFDPRPYTQLAEVLARDGQRTMAAEIRIEREDRQRQAEFDRARARLPYGAGGDWILLRAMFSYCGRGAFRALFRYGHAPAHVLLWIGGIWAFGTVLYGTIYAYGQMAPNSDVILTSRDWLAGAEACLGMVRDCAIAPLHAWEKTASFQDYETFEAYLYALDLFVPLDALGQENSWSPSRDRGWWGTFGYYARMPIQMAGWIITAVGAAVVTGLVGRKD